MGLYDYVKFECECPLCGEKVDEFQSKDGECYMGTVEFWEMKRFYGTCEGCGLWLEFYRFTNENREIKIEDFKLEIKQDFDTIEDAKAYFKDAKAQHKISEDKRMDHLKKVLTGEDNE